MHIYIVQRLILVLSLLSTTRCVNFDNRIGAALVGYGYSEDLERVTNQACFNATVAKISDPSTGIELTNSVPTSELQRLFGVDLSSAGDYKQFSSSAKAEYLRSIQESETSVSVNYYVAIQEKVTININGEDDEALTDFGKRAYHDEKLNKDFGSICGDNYIGSYNQGAVLFMGLNIKLNTKNYKIKFEASIGGNYGSLVNVASKIQSVSKENKISGTVEVRAYQYGGDPTELTGIMSKNTASCSIQDMSKCQKVVNDLLSYAKVFVSQIQNGKNLKPLGSFDYIPIVRLGL